VCFTFESFIPGPERVCEFFDILLSGRYLIKQCLHVFFTLLYNVFLFLDQLLLSNNLGCKYMIIKFWFKLVILGLLGIFD